MAFCTTRKFRKSVWVRANKRVFSSREEAEPFRLRLEKAKGQPAETYRCPYCYELHIGRIPSRIPGSWGSGDWDRLAGRLVKSLRHVLDKT
jgi:hypothetical protein